MNPVIDKIGALDNRLAAKGFPRLSAFWRATIDKFYASGKRQLTLRVGRRPFEQHVLEEVRHAGGAGDLVPAAHVVPDPERHDGRVTGFERVNDQAVLEAARGGNVDEGGLVGDA